MSNAIPQYNDLFNANANPLAALATTQLVLPTYLQGYVVAFSLSGVDMLHLGLTADNFYYSWLELCMGQIGTLLNASVDLCVGIRKAVFNFDPFLQFGTADFRVLSDATTFRRITVSPGYIFAAPAPNFGPYLGPTGSDHVEAFTFYFEQWFVTGPKPWPAGC